MADKKRSAKKPQTFNIRSLALDALILIMEKGEYEDKVLHKILEQHEKLDKRDREQ